MPTSPIATLARVRDRVSTLLLRPQVSLTLLVCGATAAITDAARAQNADPLAPLPQLQAAQDAASKSTLNVDDFKSGSTNVTNTLIYGASALGAGLALYSLYRMYQASQDESGRESSGRAFIGFCIGSTVCILMLGVGLVNYYVKGQTS